MTTIRPQLKIRKLGCCYGTHSSLMQ